MCFEGYRSKVGFAQQTMSKPTCCLRRMAPYTIEPYNKICEFRNSGSNAIIRFPFTTRWWSNKRPRCDKTIPKVRLSQQEPRHMLSADCAAKQMVIKTSLDLFTSVNRNEKYYFSHRIVSMVNSTLLQLTLFKGKSPRIKICYITKGQQEHSTIPRHKPQILPTHCLRKFY